MPRLWWILPALFLVCLIGPAACSADRGSSALEEAAPAMAPEAPTAADASSTPPGEPGQAGQPAANVGRKLIRTARLDLLVEDYDVARPAVERILGAVGGVISDAEVSHYGAYRRATVTLRVPAEALERTLIELRAIGKVEHETLATEDVTRQYVDTDARLRNLTQTETRLRALLDNQTGNLSSILEVEREITRVRGEIEVLTSQIQQLDERIALSTIHLGLREEAPDIVREPDDMWKPVRQLGRNALNILEVSLGALIAFLTAAVVALLYILPWLVPVALVLALKPSWRRGLSGLLRRRKRRKEAGVVTATTVERPGASSQPPGEPPGDRS
jgi:hypothetical protein